MASEDVVIVPYRDGPYLVRGPLVLRDQDGRPIELGRRTIALCRCGKSRMRPFCDGTHRLVQFRAPSHAENPRGEGPDRAHDRPASTAGTVSPALARLRRARDRISALLAGPGADPGQLAAHAALPLIDGACRLLEESQPLPALHLVKGAFDALGDAAEEREQCVAAAAAELAAAAVALELPGNGSWRS
jgi:CDGSH-type Zn-finger protein